LFTAKAHTDENRFSFVELLFWIIFPMVAVLVVLAISLAGLSVRAWARLCRPAA